MIRPASEVSDVLRDLQERFVCTQCGKCCSIGGNPFLTLADVYRISDFLGCCPDDTSLIPVSVVSGQPGLFSLDITRPCFFQDKVTGKCTIQESKPQNCKEWPFISYGRGMCELEHVLVCPRARGLLDEYLRGWSPFAFMPLVCG